MMTDALAWLWKNKEWLFSGSGIVILALLFRVPRRVAALLKRRKADELPTNQRGDHLPPSPVERREEVASLALPPWYSKDGDRIGEIGDLAMTRLHELDGQPVYVNALLHESGASNLQMQEAISRLVQLQMVEKLGGYPDPYILYLTPRGRRHLLS